MRLALLLPPLAAAEQVAEAERTAAALREEGHDLVITTEAKLRAADRPIPDPLKLPADLLANLNRDLPQPRTDRAWRRKRTR